MAKRKPVNRKPAEWQTDPENLKTSKVQFWSNGVMLTLLPLEEAKTLVREGRAFVISSQAIGRLNEAGEFAC